MKTTTKTTTTPQETMGFVIPSTAPEYAKITSQEDRLSEQSSILPTYSVVSATSEDAVDTMVVNGDEIQVSRKGQIRHKDTDGALAYSKSIPFFAILQNKTEATAFYDNKMICRGISGKSIYDVRALPGSTIHPAGFKCEDCPLFPFHKETQIHPVTGTAVKQTERCGRRLSIFGLNKIDTGEDPQFQRIQFSSSSFQVFNKFVKEVESAGKPLWSMVLSISAQHHAGEGNKSEFYTPLFKFERWVTAEEFEYLQVMRAHLNSQFEQATASYSSLPAARGTKAISATISAEDPFAEE